MGGSSAGGGGGGGGGGARSAAPQDDKTSECEQRDEAEAGGDGGRAGSVTAILTAALSVLLTVILFLTLWQTDARDRVTVRVLGIQQLPEFLAENDKENCTVMIMRRTHTAGAIHRS